MTRILLKFTFQGQARWFISANVTTQEVKTERLQFMASPGLFFFGRLFIAVSISLHVTDLFR
jgi:hypothetical protein